MKSAEVTRRKMRGKSVVWDHFNCHEDDGPGSSPIGGKARPAAFCSYCNLKYTFPNATKMMRHLLKCSLCPDETKRELEQSGFGEYRGDHHAATNSGSPDEDLGPPSLVRSRLSPTYQENDSPTPGTSALSPQASFLLVGNTHCRSNNREAKADHINHDASSYENAEQLSHTDRLLARAIFCTDVPFTIIESGHWQELFRHLQPSYALPSKDVLLGTLLEAEYMTTFELVSSELNKARYVSLLAHSRIGFDGDNSSLKEQVNLIITNPKSMFLACMDTGDLQSASDVADVIAGVITKVDPAQVLIVVTDLKQNVRDSWPTLSTRFPNTALVGNPVEGLGNVLRCILTQGSVQNILTQASEVCRYGQHILEQDGAVSSLLKLSSDGLSQNKYISGDAMIALEVLIQNKDRMQQSIGINKQNVDSKTKEIIVNSAFWEAIVFIVTIWRNFHLAKAKLEQEGIRLSDVAMEILNIQQFLQEAVSASALESIERSAILTEMDNSKDACCSGIHYAACLLDPRYSGSYLSERDKNSGIQYIVEFTKRAGQDSGRVIANLGEYRAKDGELWSKQYVWDAASHVAPATWWRGICDAQPLSRIAAGILGIAATSAMSKFEPIEHGESLDRDQAQKLVFVRANREMNQLKNVRPDMIMLPQAY